MSQDSVVRAAQGLGADLEGPGVVAAGAEPVDEGGGHVGPLGTQAEGLQLVGVPLPAAAYLEHRASWHGLDDPLEDGLECRARGTAGVDVALHSGLVSRQREVDGVPLPREAGRRRDGPLRGAWRRGGELGAGLSRVGRAHPL